MGQAQREDAGGSHLRLPLPVSVSPAGVGVYKAHLDPTKQPINMTVQQKHGCAHEILNFKVQFNFQVQISIL